MSEIKPVYQLKMGNGSYIDQKLASYEYNLKHGHETRTLYHADVVESLQKENENLAHRLNNAQDSAIKALEENAAQAKRIAELEAATEYQDTCTDGGKCGAGGYCKDCIQEPTKDE